MVDETIKDLIKQADSAIKEERFDDLAEFYTDDALLMLTPEKSVCGKEKIKEAFIAIAKYFNNSVAPKQGKMIFLETGDTVLVLSQTFVESEKKSDSEYPAERQATYVYRFVKGKWLCAIDNSYGTSLLNL